MSDFTINDSVLTRYEGAGGTVTVPDGVTAIADWAFAWCDTLTAVTVPASVRTIGELAFDGCTALRSVTTQGPLSAIAREAFCGCASLAVLSLGGGVTAIDDYAFCRCTALTQVDLPAGTVSVGSHAFDGCTALSAVTLPDTLAALASDAFADCRQLKRILAPRVVCETLLRTETTRVVLGYLSAPDRFSDTDATYFTDLIRARKQSLLPFILEDSAAMAGFVSGGFVREEEYDRLLNHAAQASNEGSVIALLRGRSAARQTQEIAYSLEQCPHMELAEARTKWTWTVCDDEQSLSITGYKGCDAQLSLPAFIDRFPVVKVAAQALSPKVQDLSPLRLAYLTDTLRSVKLPFGITALERGALQGCKALTAVSLPPTLTQIEEFAFAECGLTQVTLPERLTTLGGSAFQGCQALKSVTLPASLTTLGKVAFQGCVSLTELRFPAGIGTVPDGSCFRCTALTRVTVEDGMTAIGDFAFSDCKCLAEAHIPPSVTEIADFAFASCPALKIYGKADSTAARYAQKHGIPFCAE